jgi:cytochrome c-type biogenesis protein CcmE
MIVMTPKHKKRLGMVLLMLIGISAATALALTAFRENMLFFYSPSQIKAGEAPVDRVIRLGGLVTQGSVQRATDSLKVEFVVTDMAQSIPVQYTGILPDLFREGQGIVAIGKMEPNGVFVASEVLAKHDENYMPPEVASSLKHTPSNP